MTNLIFVMVLAALVIQRFYSLEDINMQTNRTRTIKSRLQSRPLPCHEFFAFCQKLYTSNRPNMTRTEGKKATIKPPQNLSNDRLLGYRCFCDSECRQYGDCCLDVLTNMNPNLTLEEFEDQMMTNHSKPLQEWECHTIPMTDTNVYMIGSCPPTFHNYAILNRCKRHVPLDDYDYTLDLPVYSKQTNYTYVNVYCAICNDDMQLYKWKIQIICPEGYPNCTADMHSWRYEPGKKRWWYHSWENETQSPYLYNVVYSIQNISLENNIYYKQFQARKCRKNITSSCPGSWLSDKEKTLCQSYSLIVKSKNTSRLYKNEYCAICNGETANNMICPKTIREFPDVSAPGISWTPSYALLLDFFGDGSQVGEAGVCGTKLCGFGELCDPIHGKCRAYTCGRKYRMDDTGKCIVDENNSDIYRRNSSSLDNACPMFYVTRDRFVRYYNNSVYIKAVKKLYNSSQYEVVNSSTISVCVSPDDSYFTWKFSIVQSILSRVCITISLICLAIHIIIHVLTPPLRNLPGKNLLCLSIALFVAQLLFEFGVGVTSSYELCIGISLIIHFGFLAAFFWMNVMAVDVYRTFGNLTKTRSPGKNAVSWEFCIYSAYAWFMPFVLVLMAFLNDFTHWMPGFEPRYANPLCWFNNRQGLLIYFAIPLAILLIANIVFFSLTVNAICQTRNSAKIVRRNSSIDSNESSRMWLYVKLALIMGLTWILGFVAALTNMEIIWYFFILFNCLQGTFIFIAFSCKKNVFQMMQRLTCSSHCNVTLANKSKNTTDSQTTRSFHTLVTSVSRKFSSFDVAQ